MAESKYMSAHLVSICASICASISYRSCRHLGAIMPFLSGFATVPYTRVIRYVHMYQNAVSFS